MSLKALWEFAGYHLGTWKKNEYKNHEKSKHSKSILMEKIMN